MRLRLTYSVRQYSLKHFRGKTGNFRYAILLRNIEFFIVSSIDYNNFVFIYRFDELEHRSGDNQFYKTNANCITLLS